MNEIWCKQKYRHYIRHTDFYGSFEARLEIINNFFRNLFSKIEWKACLCKVNWFSS